MFLGGPCSLTGSDWCSWGIWGLTTTPFPLFPDSGTPFLQPEALGGPDALGEVQGWGAQGSTPHSLVFVTLGGSLPLVQPLVLG